MRLELTRLFISIPLYAGDGTELSPQHLGSFPFCIPLHPSWGSRELQWHPMSCKAQDILFPALGFHPSMGTVPA